MIDKRLSELKAEESDLPRDHVQSEICTLLQIRSLLFQGIDCPVAVSVTPSLPNSKTLLINKEDKCDRPPVKALKSASQQCSEVKISDVESYLRPSAAAPLNLDDDAEASSSQHLPVVGSVVSAQWGAKQEEARILQQEVEHAMRSISVTALASEYDFLIVMPAAVLTYVTNTHVFNLRVPLISCNRFSIAVQSASRHPACRFHGHYLRFLPASLQANSTRSTTTGRFGRSFLL